MYRKLITALIIVVGLLSACSSPSKESNIVGKWTLGYAVDDGISIYKKESIKGFGADAVFLFTEDGKCAIANYGKEYNGTWQEVPTTDESKKKYEVTQTDGKTSYMYLDLNMPDELYIIGSEISTFVSDKVVFVQDKTVIDKAKQRSFEEAKSDVENADYEHALEIFAQIMDYEGVTNLVIEALDGIGNYKMAIELAEENGVSEERIIELKNAYYDVLITTDLEAALEMAKELEKPQEEIDILRSKVEEIKAEELKSLYKTAARDSDPDKVYFESRAKKYSDVGVLQLKKDGLYFNRDLADFPDIYYLDNIKEVYKNSDGKVAIKTGAAVDFAFEILDKPTDDWILVLQGALSEKEPQNRNQYAHVIGTYVNVITGEPDLVVTDISSSNSGWFLEGTYEGIAFCGSWHIQDYYLGIGLVQNTVRSENQPSEIYIFDDGTALIRNYDSTKKQMIGMYYTQK